MTTKLTHGDTPRSDEKLAQEAAQHLAKSPNLQLIAELLTRLREMDFPWWTSQQLRDAHPAGERMAWYTERPDLRQRITSALTGLAPKAARNKTPDFQAELVDSVIDSGDITAAIFDSAYEPTDIAVYGPAAELWKLFRRRMPWDDDSTAHQDLIGWLLGALLVDKSSLDATPRTPILTALAVRTAIDGRVWHSRIPLDVRVAIDNARFAQLRDKPEVFTAAQDLAIATPALIAASIPLKELAGVFDVAGVALGFEMPSPTPTPSLRPSVAPPVSPSVVPPRSVDAGNRGVRESSGRANKPENERSEEKTDPPPPPDDPEPAAPFSAVPVTVDGEWKISSHPPKEAASKEARDESEELEHTNPWNVPTAGDLAAIIEAPKTTGKRRRD